MAESVEALAACGVPKATIARVVGVSDEVIDRHYRCEYESGGAAATAKVALTLYQMAVSGEHLPATVFWLKARAGWRENDRVLVEHTGSLGLHRLDVASLSTETLEAIEREAGALPPPPGLEADLGG